MGNDDGQPEDAGNEHLDDRDDGTGGDPRSISPRSSRSPLPFEDLKAPAPIPAVPPTGARVLAFGSILIGGLLGGMIGYGTGDLMATAPIWSGVGALVGAAAGAIGVGVVANLTMQAMNEWRAVEHPESETRASSGLVVRKTTGSSGAESEPTAGTAPDSDDDG